VGKVVYVTGAPATGKSTLCRTLAALIAGTESFCYSERLQDHINRRSEVSIDEIGIRRLSAKVVRPDDVAAIDSLLLQRIDAAKAGTSHLLIDSHPVTKEDYGFRITAFSARELAALRIDSIVCLFADPDVLAARIADNAQGRPMPTRFELLLHVQTQIAVAAQYGVLSGLPCHLIDSAVSQEQLVQTVMKVTQLTAW